MIYVTGERTLHSTKCDYTLKNNDWTTFWSGVVMPQSSGQNMAKGWKCVTREEGKISVKNREELNLTLTELIENYIVNSTTWWMGSYKEI